MKNKIKYKKMLHKKHSKKDLAYKKTCKKFFNMTSKKKIKKILIEIIKTNTIHISY